MTEEERERDLQLAELQQENAELRAEIKHLKSLVEDIDFSESITGTLDP